MYTFYLCLKCKKKNQTCAQNIQSSEIQNAAREKQIQGMTHLKLK